MVCNRVFCFATDVSVVVLFTAAIAMPVTVFVREFLLVLALLANF